MTRKTTQTPDPSTQCHGESPRRRFMKAAAYAPALAIAGTRPGQAAPAAPAEPVQEPTSGYRETDHIRRYYATAQY